MQTAAFELANYSESMAFYLRIEGLQRDFRRTYSAKRIGSPAAGKAAPQGQGRLAAYPIDIGRIHLHRKWQELWAELS